MLAGFMVVSVLAGRIGFVAWPAPAVYADDLAEHFAVAEALDRAEARFAAPDDAPLTAAQIPALREALAAAAAARFDRAAAALVAFATVNPDLPESGWALRRAHAYWRALGRDTEATTTRRRYEQHHAAREPRAAAEFFWSHRLDLPEGPLREDHARVYLAQHADHGPPDLRIIAEAELAVALWRRACAESWHGLCVDFSWHEQDDVCGFVRVPLFTVRGRDRTLRREALRHAALAGRGRALDLARVAPWRRPALRRALGAAALMAADDAIESMIALEHPRDQSYFVEDYKHGSGIPAWEQEYREQKRLRDDSARKLHQWLDAYRHAGDILRSRVAAVNDAHDGPAILTVMVRLALAYAEVSGEVDLATSIPKRPDEDYWLCEPRNDYEFDLARTIITNCADRARNSGLVNPAVDLCFTGFGRLHGDEDTLAEFTGAPPAGPARPRIPWAPTSVCLRTVWTVAGERGEHRGIIDAELRPCEQAVLDGPHVGDRDVVAAIAGADAALGAADGDDFVATRPRRTALAPSNVERAAYGRCHRPDAAP